MIPCDIDSQHLHTICLHKSISYPRTYSTDQVRSGLHIAFEATWSSDHVLTIKPYPFVLSSCTPIYFKWISNDRIEKESKACCLPCRKSKTYDGMSVGLKVPKDVSTSSAFWNCNGIHEIARLYTALQAYEWWCYSLPLTTQRLRATDYMLTCPDIFRSYRPDRVGYVYRLLSTSVVQSSVPISPLLFQSKTQDSSIYVLLFLWSSFISMISTTTI